MRPRSHDRGTPALALLEAAFHLLRTTPASSWLSYFLGTVPWVLAVLAYGAEMLGPGRFAPEGALVLAIGYLAMKAGQSVFASGLLRRLGASAGPLAGNPAASGAAGAIQRWLGELVRQSGVQPWSLIVLPVAFVIGLPFGWTYAYFQSFSILGDHRAARRHAALWPRQNHLVLVLLAVVGVCVFLNAAITIILLPTLLSQLLGIDTAAARNPWGMISWTTAALAAALTYLATGPLAKAVYTLRCFQGEARRSGEDLRAELHERRRATASVALGVLALAVIASVSRAAVPPDLPVTSPAPASAPGPTRIRDRSGPPIAKLDQALDRVLGRPEFAWRLPRAANPGDQERGFFAPVAETLSRWGKAALDSLDRLISWLRRRWPQDRGASANAGFGWIGSTYLWLGILALAVLIGTVMVVRRRRAAKPEAPVAAAPVPLDPLADPSTAAAAPPDEWLARADELLRAGDTRHAVRALYLASLSLLAHRQLLQPERSKSNRDYLSELRRRARERPQLGDLFQTCSDAFERVWYGHHPASADLVAWFRAQHGELAQHAS